MAQRLAEADTYKQLATPRAVWQIYGEMRQGQGNFLGDESQRGKSKIAGKETLENIYGSGKGNGRTMGKGVN